MTLNLPLLYFVWTEEYCQTSPNKNKSPNLWHVTSILICCIFAKYNTVITFGRMKLSHCFGSFIWKENKYIDNYLFWDKGSIQKPRDTFNYFSPWVFNEIFLFEFKNFILEGSKNAYQDPFFQKLTLTQYLAQIVSIYE